MSSIRSCGKACFITLIAAVFAIGITSYANSGVVKRSASAQSCELPRSAFRSADAHAAWNRLWATPEGCQEWHSLTETAAIFEQDYYRKLKAKEVSKLFKKGLAEVDPHTAILTPREAKNLFQTFKGSFGGIGAEVQLSRDENLPKGVMIVSTYDDSPSAKAGLKAGDIIVGIEEWINGIPEMKSVDGLTIEQAVDKLRGEPNTTVNVKVFRTGAPDYIAISIVRDTIQIKYVKSELKQDVGYIRLNSFAETTVQLTRKAVEDLEPESQQKNGRPIFGYVLDLRNNPGGLLDQADGVLDLFLERGRYANNDASTTISMEIRGERTATSHADGVRDIIAGKPLLILTNSGSASASEIVAGALQIHGRALIASSSLRTFGKGSVQSIVPLGDGGAVRLTISQYLVGSKGCERPVQGRGVVPDILLKKAEGEGEASTFEEKLPESLSTSKVSDANCKYRFAVSAEHRAAAYRMLEVMGLQRAEQPSIKKAQ